jgi:hypothetical protein
MPRRQCSVCWYAHIHKRTYAYIATHTTPDILYSATSVATPHYPHSIAPLYTTPHHTPDEDGEDIGNKCNCGGYGQSARTGHGQVTIATTCALTQTYTLTHINIFKSLQLSRTHICSYLALPPTTQMCARVCMGGSKVAANVCACVYVRAASLLHPHITVRAASLLHPCGHRPCHLHAGPVLQCWVCV